MRNSTSHFDQPIPLSKTRAYYHARNAVLDGMPLKEFLEWRKRFYEAKYRLSHYPLPDDAIIEDGEVKKIANSASEVFWQQARDPTGEDMGVPIQTELEREEIARQLEIVEEEIALVFFYKLINLLFGKRPVFCVLGNLSGLNDEIVTFNFCFSDVAFFKAELFAKFFRNGNDSF